MGIIDKIFKKKVSNVIGEHSERSAPQPVSTGDIDMPLVPDMTIPENLHSAIRMIVRNNGDAFLEQKAFVNMLNDYQMFKDSPVLKNVLRNLQSGGYITKLRTCNNWQIDSRSIGMQFIKEFGVKEQVVYYVIKCIGYGIGQLSEAPHQPNISVKSDATTLFVESSKNDFDTLLDKEKASVQKSSIKTVDYKLPSTSLFNNSDLHNYFFDKGFMSSDYSLPIIIGKDDNNNVVCTDLAEMSNLLVSGISGTGKSTSIHIILSSLIMRKKPCDVKFVIIDTNCVEYGKYSQLKDYYIATENMLQNDECVVTDIDKAFTRLAAVTREIDLRYSKLSGAGARSIIEYNKSHDKLPYIVLVIDDFGTMMMAKPKLMEQYMTAIAGRGRIVGVHVIAVTQFSTRNVLNTMIRSLFISRLCFKQMNVSESRLVLNSGIASKLQNKGECVLLTVGNLQHLQTFKYTTFDMSLLFSYVLTQTSNIVYELPEDPNQPTSVPISSSSDLDPLFVVVARDIMAVGSASTSNVQRKYSIGYNRVTRLMDQLESAGVVGPQIGARSRPVLIKYEYELQNIIRKLK